MPDLLVKLYDIPSVTPYLETLKAAGIMVRAARAYEKHQVLAWVGRTFGSGWASECDVAFSNHPISCFLAIENHTIVGFACYESTWKNFFGPLGVAANARRRGIGTALLLVCLHAMAAHGYAYAIIGSAGTLTFYTKAVGAIPIKGSEPGVYRDRLQEPGSQRLQCPRTFYTDLDNLICKSGQITCPGWSARCLCHRVFLHQPNALARISGECYAHSRHTLTST